MRNVVHAVICAAALAVVGGGARAGGQGSVGSGPLTGALTDIEPTTGVITIGRVRLAPGVVVREIGWDSNVFDEAENPKEDFVVSVAPDAALFTRLRFLQALRVRRRRFQLLPDLRAGEFDWPHPARAAPTCC